VFHKNVTKVVINVVSGVSLQVSDFWLLVTCYWLLARRKKREANGQNADTCLRGKDLTPDTRNLKPDFHVSFLVDYLLELGPAKGKVRIHCDESAIF
jgi:hypothetical protein